MVRDIAHPSEEFRNGSAIDELRTHATLLAAVRNLQDVAAWQRFLMQYEPIILRWSKQAGLQRADAEDVTQEVMAKLAKVLPRFEYDSSKRFRDWLATIFRNALRDRWRRRNARPGDFGTGASTARAAIEQISYPADVEANSFAEDFESKLRPALLEAREIAERVRKRVETHTWRAFWLTAIEGRPGGDVAKRLGMKVAHVYVAKNRVIKLLRAERDGHK